MNKKIGLGDIVISKQGRDEGVFYIVIALLSDNYYMIVNGDNKRFENPKRKVKRHLDKAGKTVESIKAKLEKGDKIFDSEVYSAIRKFKEELNQK
jgi:ribosomal protein L14E/L6E/L27E